MHSAPTGAQGRRARTLSNARCIQARRWPAAVRLALRRFPAARYIRMIAFTASAVVVCGISSKPIMPSYPISSRQANTAR